MGFFVGLAVRCDDVAASCARVQGRGYYQTWKTLCERVANPREQDRCYHQTWKTLCERRLCSAIAQFAFGTSISSQV